jgi:DNA-binding XRE family transcriptional regulator
MKKEELKKWRKKLGMTQVELAEFLGCCRWTLIAWEQGKNPVPHTLNIIRAVKAIETLTGVKKNGKGKTTSNASRTRK